MRCAKYIWGLLMRYLLLLALLLTNTLAFASVDPYEFVDSNESMESFQPEDERVRANVLTVDTRDEESCKNVQYSLSTMYPNNDYSELCLKDEDNPFNSVVAIEDHKITHKIYFDSISEAIPGQYQNLAKETRNVMGLSVLTIGLIYMLPEDVYKWDKDKMGDLGKNWKENVQAGPVIDKDDWWINYIGHPMSVAAYHLIARHAGLEPWQSFGYSVFMSTVFWEYGIEAFAEVPSIQDLILTPVLGSLLGELFYSAEDYIDDNDGKLWGSERLGSIAKNVMNPSEPLRRWINDSFFESEFLKDSRTYFYLQHPNYQSDYFNHSYDEHEAMINRGPQIGFGIEFRF